MEALSGWTEEKVFFYCQELETNLVPRVSHLPAPKSGRVRDAGNEVAFAWSIGNQSFIYVITDDSFTQKSFDNPPPLPRWEGIFPLAFGKRIYSIHNIILLRDKRTDYWNWITLSCDLLKNVCHWISRTSSLLSSDKVAVKGKKGLI